MNDAEENIKKLELLKLARQQINDEYLQKNTDNYKTWLSAADRAWITEGIKLPFTSPMFPKESDVVARALELYNASLPALLKQDPQIKPSIDPLPRSYLDEVKTIFTPGDIDSGEEVHQEESKPFEANHEEIEPEEIEPEEIEPEEIEPEEIEMEENDVEFDEYEEELEYRNYEEELVYQAAEKAAAEVQSIAAVEKKSATEQTNKCTPKFLLRQNRHRPR